MDAETSTSIDGACVLLSTTRPDSLDRGCLAQCAATRTASRNTAPPEKALNGTVNSSVQLTEEPFDHTCVPEEDEHLLRDAQRAIVVL